MDKEKLHTLQDSVSQYRQSRSRSKVPSLDERLGSAEGELGNLVDNLNRINRLSQSLKGVLEQPLVNHCRIAQMRNNVLVLAVDSSEWASRLRFEKLNLLSKLRNNGFPGISSIDIIVQPDDF